VKVHITKHSENAAALGLFLNVGRPEEYPVIWRNFATSTLRRCA
jgi:hypothetical protein